LRGLRADAILDRADGAACSGRSCDRIRHRRTVGKVAAKTVAGGCYAERRGDSGAHGRIVGLPHPAAR
jgi:hypothetical protein